MIKLCTALPRDLPRTVQALRIKSEYALYSDIARFYTGEGSGAISLSAGGGCVICGDFEKKELEEFLHFTSPESIFCDTGAGISPAGYTAHTVTVLERTGGGRPADTEYNASSDKVYAILETAGAFSLPPYEYFAVDFCRRKNHGALVCATCGDKAAAIAQVHEDAAVLCGVAALEKGLGSRVLQGVLYTLENKTVYALADEKVIPFYTKNGFALSGRAVYYIKTTGEENELFYL